MTEWHIQTRAHACTACGKPFADQQPFHTLLFDHKTDLVRSDVCQACWDAQFSQGARERKGFVSYWQGVYQAPPPPSDPIHKENAEPLLRKLIELNEPRYVPAGFILAVMLERKRLLKVKEQLVRDGQRVFIYEQPGTGDVFTIPDPNLQLNQLEEVQRDVATLLEQGLPALNAPAGEASSGEPPVESLPAAPEPLPPAPASDSQQEPAPPSRQPSVS